jgi:hypothetical protein
VLRNNLFGLKYLFFDADSGWKECGSRIRDGKNWDPGFGINYPQHCLKLKVRNCYKENRIGTFIHLVAKVFKTDGLSMVVRNINTKILKLKACL